MSATMTLVERAEAEPANLLAVVARASRDPQCDVDKLDKLLQMAERQQKSEAVAVFNSELAAMQSQMPTIIKHGEAIVNGQLRYKFARFEHVVETVRPILQEHGFAVTFKTSEGVNGGIVVTGILTHKNGHREETTLPLPSDKTGSKNEVQAIGSSIQYGKRMALCCLLGIATGDDNDANPNPQPPRATDAAKAEPRAQRGLKMDEFIAAWKHKNPGKGKPEMLKWCETVLDHPIDGEFDWTPARIKQVTEAL